MSGYGPGKYDAACTQARTMTQAETTLLVVINGKAGSGFSVQSKDPHFGETLVSLLRAVADQIERDTRGTAH